METLNLSLPTGDTIPAAMPLRHGRSVRTKTGIRRPASWSALLLACTLPALAQPGSPPGNAPPGGPSGNTGQEANFLPKFPHYVAWPARARPATGQPYQLCIVGRDPFGATMDRITTGELVQGHAVRVRRLTGATEAAGCHLAFVDGGDDERTQQLLTAFAHRPVLTVTNNCRGRSQGMINFLTSGGRVRFAIDNASASAHGINISSRLLALAISVRSRP